jgi:hypothetical protein
MDAMALSSEGRRELDELRSRAYGPDADIHRDAEALARLIELEGIARNAPAAVPADSPVRIVETVPGGPVAASEPTADTGPSGAADEDDGGEDARAVAPAPSTARRPWWRRVPVAAVVAVAALVGAGIGVWVSALGAPQPATTLARAPLDGASLDFELYGIRSDEPVRYEPFHGLEVWSAETDQGTRCIVVTTSTSEWMAAGCAPEPLGPVADVPFYPGMRDIDGLDLPMGSVVRFTLDGDVMRVWIAEASTGA